ncbi:PTPRS-like protein, partial [Mya arenaria]
MVMWVSLTRSCYGLGEACTADDSSNCTEIDLGFSGCTNGNAVNECADDNTECIAGFCKCVSTHYDNNGDTSRGECDKKKKLGEGCSTNQDCTSSDSNSECSGNKCQCQSSYYDDNGNNAEGTCASKVNLEGTCTATTSGSGDPCNTAFAMCTGSESSYTCKCQGGYYKSDGNTCSKEKKLGEGCSTNQDCTSSDSNSECSGNKCQCHSSYYDDNGNNAEGTCASKVNLEGTCTAATSGSGDPCNTKFAVCTGRRSSYTCKCQGGYYKSGGNTCSKEKKLGEGCSTNQDCTSSDSNSECSGNKCQCQSSYYDDNGNNAEGTCASKVNLEGTCTAATSGSGDPCNTKFAVCTGRRSSYTCKCQGGYYKSGGNTCSKELPLDSPCLQPDACATAHSVCLQKKCQCSENYYNTNDANQYKKTCKSKHYLNEKCDDEANPNQCKDDKAECSNSNNMKLCRCIAGYHEEKGVCIANKALGEECDVSTECSDSAAVCTGSNKVCTCGSNHYDDNAFSAGGNCQEISQLQVSSITFSQVHTTTMIVSWTPQSGKARFISDYTVQWGSNDSSIAEGFKENIMSTTTKITGLTPGQNYRITVTSVNKVTQADSPRSTFVSKQRSSKPMPPNSLDLDGSNLDATDKEITLAWTRPSSGVVSRYDIEVLDGTELKQTTFAVGTASATLTFYDMRNGYTYNVKIIYRSETYDGTNTEPSQPFESPFKTDVQVPDPPTDVSCLSIYDEYITLSWTAPQKPNGDLVQYVVHTLSYPSNSEKFQNNTSSTGTTYDVHGLEPEPQAAPVVRSVYDIRKNSFNVSWSLIGPRPGQVTYTVILTADTGADSKSYYVTGYGNTNLYADGLEEYWNYDVSVTARTNVGGAKTSDTTTKNRTLPSAPGAVTEFEAVKVQLRTDNFHKMTIQWKAPLLLQRNSVIKEYVLRHNVGNTTASSVGDEEFKTMSFTSVTSDVFYSQEFDVIPESTYKFEVVKEGSKDQTFISLNLVREFFTEETNGRVQRTALLGCKSSACPENFLGINY